MGFNGELVGLLLLAHDVLGTDRRISTGSTPQKLNGVSPLYCTYHHAQIVFMVIFYAEQQDNSPSNKSSSLWRGHRPIKSTLHSLSEEFYSQHEIDENWCSALNFFLSAAPFREEQGRKLKIPDSSE